MNGTLTVLPVVSGSEFKVLVGNFLCPQCGNTSNYNISLVVKGLSACCNHRCLCESTL